MITEKQNQGQQAEQVACDFLLSKGMALLEKNYFCSLGEIDLIMNDKKTIVFVEVRFRRTTRFGSGAETVDRHKQKKLIATAAHYLQHNPRAAKNPCRFDVVSLTKNNNQQKLDWIPNAFLAG